VVYFTFDTDVLDIKEYISSGIIESYVLNAVSEQERREVECMSKIYPEIQQELTLTQNQIEQLASSFKIDPPADLKMKVMAKIAQTEQDELRTVKAEAKVIELNSASSTNNSRTWKKIAAVAIVAVVATGALFVKSKTDLSQLESKAVAIEESAKENLFAMQSELEQYQQEKKFLLHDATIAVPLSGTPVSPDSKMKIYWNSIEKRLLMAGMNLPATSKELQYQLWAIVDGVPVDLGVFDLPKQQDILSRNTDVKNVQAFAVTLETKGGNPTPNLEQLYVIGNV
jgi:anti-sigma-K factor RskA